MNRPEKERAVTWKAGNLKRFRKLLRSRLLRAVVSLGLLALIISRLNLHDFTQLLKRVDLVLLALGVAVFLVANMASVLKWWLIIRAQKRERPYGKEPVSYRYLTSLFYIGLFFNNFLPTNFGGDFIKAWKLARVTGQPAEAAGSVVADRASSTFALLMIAMPPALIELRLVGKGVALMVLAMFVVLLLGLGLFASERVAIRLSRYPVLRSDFFGLREHLRSFYYSLYEFRSKPAVLVAVMVLSVVYQGLAVALVYVLALSLEIHVSPIFFFLFIPVVMAVGMIPISLNGIGMREGATVFLFSQVGVSTAESFSLSVLCSLVMTVISLAGGVFYLFDRTTPATGKENGTM
ncbi:MAG: lysylphosphatidylglycerol synthase transmembrane domain-containing protein [Actinomycetota bacterium]